MEFESETGSKITLQKGQILEIGRGLGLDSTDSTLSRRQISLSLQQSPNPKPRVRFEVIGKNPIWVYDGGRDEIRVFKRFEKGEMVDGDKFCLSWKKPVWFGVRERVDKREIGGILDLELKAIDVSDINPVKEFGFLVIGHEFDHYPKHKIRPPKTWDWFLEKSKKESDDDDDDDEISGRKRSKSRRRKRKKAGVNDGEDDEWTGESEEEKELISKSRKVKRPNYSTRSKDRKSSTSTQKKIDKRDEKEDDEEDEDEEDETLGGFIVSNDEVKEEEEEDDETELDEEEEDFEDDDDED